MRTRRPKPLAPDDPFVACATCVSSWVTVLNGARLATVVRCACWHAHQAKIQPAVPAVAAGGRTARVEAVRGKVSS